MSEAFKSQPATISKADVVSNSDQRRLLVWLME